MLKVGAKKTRMKAVFTDSEMSVAKLYTYQNEGNFVLYMTMVVKSFIECFEMS